MKWKTRMLALGLAAWTSLEVTQAIAADHRDGAAVLRDASTDINDLYIWNSPDATKVRIALTVFPAATATSKFSDANLYVVHTASRANFAATMATPTDIICSFNAAQQISCWVGADTKNFVNGDASKPAGIQSADKKITVFAGLRKDHFFFNLDGFNAVRTTVKGATAAQLGTADAGGCYPNLMAAVRTALVTQLAKAPNGANPVDFFLNLNTLAIVLEIDKTLLNTGGPIVSAWAATHRKGN